MKNLDEIANEGGDAHYVRIVCQFLYRKEKRLELNKFQGELQQFQFLFSLWSGLGASELVPAGTFTLDFMM